MYSLRIIRGQWSLTSQQKLTFAEVVAKVVGLREETENRQNFDHDKTSTNAQYFPLSVVVFAFKPGKC